MLIRYAGYNDQEGTKQCSGGLQEARVALYKFECMMQANQIWGLEGN